MKNEFITTAIKDANGNFKYFRVTEDNVHIYDYKKEDIIKVRCMILPTLISSFKTNNMETDYWGLLKDDDLTIIMQNSFLFNRCFLGGALVQEKEYPGTCVNLKVEIYKK